MRKRVIRLQIIEKSVESSRSSLFGQRPAEHHPNERDAGTAETARHNPSWRDFTWLDPIQAPYRDAMWLE